MSLGYINNITLLNLGQNIFDQVVNQNNQVDIFDQVKNLPTKDHALFILSHLNSLFMNFIVNPELQNCFNYSDYKRKESSVIYHNEQLKSITAELRLSASDWRNKQIDNILNA